MLLVIWVCVHCLRGFNDLERWQTFHAKREHVRLTAVQLIQPFDPDLATEFEQRCNGMQNVEEASELGDVDR